MENTNNRLKISIIILSFLFLVSITAIYLVVSQKSNNTSTPIATRDAELTEGTTTASTSQITSESLEEDNGNIYSKLEKALKETVYPPKYRVYVLEGYVACLNYLLIDFNGEEIEQTIFNNGHKDCAFKSGTTTKVVNGEVTYSLDGINWQSGSPKNSTGWEFPNPIRFKVESVVPSGEINEQVITGQRPEDSKIHVVYDRTDPRWIDPVTNVENLPAGYDFGDEANLALSKAEYHMQTKSGKCVLTDDFAEGECHIESWYFDKDFGMIANTSFSSADYGQEVIYDFSY